MSLDNIKKEKSEAHIKLLSKTIFELESDYEDKIHELSLIRQIGEMFHYAIDLHEASQKIVNILYDEMLSDNCSLMLFDEQANELELYAIKSKVVFENSEEDYTPRIGKRFKIGEGAAGWALEQRKIVLIQDIAKDERFVAYDKTAVEVNSLVCIPLLNNDKPDGVINISYNMRDSIPRASINIFNILMHIIGYGIGNIRLLAELKDANLSLKDTNENLHKTLAELHKTQQYIFNTEELSSVGILAAGIAHEFNNIFAAIQGYSEISLLNTDLKDHQKNFKTIIKLSNRATKIIENLLDFSRKPLLKKKNVNLNKEIRSIIYFVKPELNSRGITVKKNLHKIPNITCDLSQLSRVFLHLISNARDAMEDKGGTLTVLTKKVKDWVEVVFSDTGKGIEPNILKNIYDPFVTTKGAFGGGSQPGIGLGLSVAYGIIKNHKGEIVITSSVGRGTEVSLRLPVEAKETKPQKKPKKKPSRR